MKALDELKIRLLEVNDLNGATALLRWDQQTDIDKEMSIEPYLDYLWRKYQPLYRLEERVRTAVGIA